MGAMKSLVEDFEEQAIAGMGEFGCPCLDKDEEGAYISPAAAFLLDGWLLARAQPVKELHLPTLQEGNQAFHQFLELQGHELTTCVSTARSAWEAGILYANDCVRASFGAVVVPPGYALVPEQPTVAMRLPWKTMRGYSWFNKYQAMLKAAAGLLPQPKSKSNTAKEEV